MIYTNIFNSKDKIIEDTYRPNNIGVIKFADDKKIILINNSTYDKTKDFQLVNKDFSILPNHYINDIRRGTWNVLIYFDNKSTDKKTKELYYFEDNYVEINNKNGITNLGIIESINVRSGKIYNQYNLILDPKNKDINKKRILLCEENTELVLKTNDGIKRFEVYVKNFIPLGWKEIK
jgi:hypothetical protein